MALATDIRIEDVKTTQNGAKVANIKGGDGDALVYLPDEFLSIPFDPSTFVESDSLRKDLAINITDAMRKELARLDAVLMVYISEHSERLLKKRLTLEQVRASYSSCIRTTKEYPATVKTKVDLGGGRCGNACWNEDGESIDLPDSWRAFLIKPRIVVSNLWMFGSKFGPVLRLTDALLQAKPECENAKRCSPFKVV